MMKNIQVFMMEQMFPSLVRHFLGAKERQTPPCHEIFLCQFINPQCYISSMLSFVFLLQVLDDFATKHSPDTWSSGSALPLPGLDAQLAKYQNPTQADA